MSDRRTKNEFEQTRDNLLDEYYHKVGDGSKYLDAVVQGLILEALVDIRDALSGDVG